MRTKERGCRNNDCNTHHQSISMIQTRYRGPHRESHSAIPTVVLIRPTPRGFPIALIRHIRLTPIGRKPNTGYRSDNPPKKRLSEFGTGLMRHRFRHVLFGFIVETSTVLNPFSPTLHDAQIRFVWTHSASSSESYIGPLFFVHGDVQNTIGGRHRGRRGQAHVQTRMCMHRGGIFSISTRTHLEGEVEMDSMG